MSNWGIKASLPGHDVFSATPEKCAIHSGYPSPKAVMGNTPVHAGSVTIAFNNNPPSATNTTLYTVPHGYGYVPMVLASGVYSTGMSSLEGTLPIQPTATFKVWAEADSTSMRIRINVDTAGWGSIIGNTLLVSYYIFAESGT